MLFSPGLYLPMGKKPAAAAAGLGLQTNASAFWSMETTSWTDDTASGITLTGNNSPTTTTGLVGNGLSVDGSTQTLSHADASALNITGGAFSVQCWFKGTGPAGSSIISKNDGGFANREFFIGLDFTSQHVFTGGIYDTGGSVHVLTDTVVDAADGTWHHVLMTFDGTTLKFCVDNRTPLTTASLGTVQGPTTSQLFIGKDGDNNSFVSAVIDQVGLWKGRDLMSQSSLLYNGRNGLSWAAMA